MKERYRIFYRRGIASMLCYRIKEGQLYSNPWIFYLNEWRLTKDILSLDHLTKTFS